LLDRDNLLEKLSEDKILEIVQRFGGEIVRYGNREEIIFSTICHNGNSHKLYYYRDTKTFHCYTNCGHMSIFSLIMKLNKCDFYDSLKYIAKEVGYSDRYGFNVATMDSDINEEFKVINKYLEIRRKKNSPLVHLNPIDNPEILEYFEHDVFYQGWIEEGISIESMKRFKVCWYEYQKAIIIPHSNIEGKIVGIRRRGLRDEDSNNKYMPLALEGKMHSHSLNLNFYGLYEHLEAIKRFKKVVIVESEKAVLLGNTYYKDDCFVIATCGFNISNWHRDLLLQLGVEEVIIAFDKDFDPLEFTEDDIDEKSSEYIKYQQYINRINSLAQKFVPYFRTCVVWDEYGM
jgi:hypothetical protein